MPSPFPVPASPSTRAVDLVEELHGHLVADPYRWLELGDDPEVRAWVETQNDHSRAILSRLPGRDRLYTRLRALLQVGTSTACAVAGERVFSIDRWGHHDQAVLVVRPAFGQGVARTVVDPHLLTGDPTAAIDWYQPSPDGRLVAFGLSRGGDERSTLHVLDVDHGELLRERIPHTRACSLAWAPDSSWFVYTRYPDPARHPDEEPEYWRRVYRHRLGEDWHRDELVWGELPDKTAWANVSLSRDGRWLLVHLSLGWSRVDVHLVDLRSGAHTVMLEGADAVSNFTVVGEHVVGLTTLDAPRGRVVRAPLVTAWHEQWETIVPERERVLEALVTTSGSLLVMSAEHAVAHLERWPLGPDATVGHGEEIPLPELGSLAGLSGHRDRDLAFFSFTSFTRPPTLMRWIPQGTEPWSDHHDGDDVGNGHGPGRYVVEQVTYHSVDGTSVRMFLVRAEDTRPGPDTPCILTGYGGFSVVLGPAYAAAVVAACDDGAIYAVANIRGGAEEGEAWHRAGMGPDKQRSFDDFLAAADWLVEHDYTSRRRLAIRGGSNGGLLMGAAITQRPDLCAAAQIAVPLLDMVRYHHFLIARLWIPEYGDPDRPDELAWLLAYSPYHHVVDGTCYPGVLLTAAEGDSRVDPCHARKMAARLQAATSCGRQRPVLLREETDAGHGQGKPVSKQADELADVLAYLWWQLDVEPAASGHLA